MPLDFVHTPAIRDAVSGAVGYVPVTTPLLLLLLLAAFGTY